MHDLVLFFIFFCLSFLLTWITQKAMIKFKVLDLPSERGMHSNPKVGSGGVAVVLSLISSITFFYYKGNLEIELFYSLLTALIIIGIVGLIDDIKKLPYKFRLLIQFLVSTIIILFYLEKLGSLVLYPLPLSGIIVYLIFGLSLVWFMNLYNFMDGINGLASIQGISFFLGVGIVSSIFYPELDHNYFWSFVAIFLGFLLWNFPKARIFLGDVGSGSMGIFIAIYLVHLSTLEMNLFWIGVLLMSIFITDATYTLLVRIFRNLPFHQAHNSHAYQKITTKYHSHTKVTLSIFLINTLIILPLSIISLYLNFSPFFFLMIIMVILALACFYFKAGIQEL